MKTMTEIMITTAEMNLQPEKLQSHQHHREMPRRVQQRRKEVVRLGRPIGIAGHRHLRPWHPLNLRRRERQRETDLFRHHHAPFLHQLLHQAAVVESRRKWACRVIEKRHRGVAAPTNAFKTLQVEHLPLLPYISLRLPPSSCCFCAQSVCSESLKS